MMEREEENKIKENMSELEIEWMSVRDRISKRGKKEKIVRMRRKWIREDELG